MERTERTFYSVSRYVSPTRIIRLAHNSTADGEFFEIVNYGMDNIGRVIDDKELAKIFGAARKQVKVWIMEKSGRDAVQIMSALNY
jgi:hypothetical protein